MKHAPPPYMRSLFAPPVRRNSGVTLIVVLLILVVGFVYEWKKGALDWE